MSRDKCAMPLVECESFFRKKLERVQVCERNFQKVYFGKFATYTLKLSERNFRKENFRKFLGVRPPLHSHEPNLYAMENQRLDE